VTRFLDRDDPELRRAWTLLANAPINALQQDDLRDVAPCPETGETWQYMGTEDAGGPWMTIAGETRGGRVDGPLHVFRHRWHPDAKARVYLRIPSRVNP
jgi:hypothetical protein